jgi:hypothetical protein
LADGRNDFLGRRKRGEILPSFGVAPGGYLCYYDADLPEGKKWHAYFHAEDEKARQRLDAKQTAGHGRIERRRRKP